MSLVYISVGSNVGNRQQNLNLAQENLEKQGIKIKRASPFYESEALCKPGQTMPPFLNGVFEVETYLEPEPLLDLLEKIEQTMGRCQKGDWQPRPMDLDILFYGENVIKTKRLAIPHPEMAKRWFVLKPLADLAPDWVHPVLGKTIKEILCNFSSTPPT